MQTEKSIEGNGLSEKASHNGHQHLETGGVIEDRSLSQRLSNPLEGIPREKLISNVKAFCVEKGLEEHEHHLIKGAIVAQSPQAFEELDVLDEQDRETLRYEKSHRWSHPKLLYATIFLSAVGAATQGWDQTGSNGANLSFPDEFGIPGGSSAPGFVPVPGVDYEHNTWLIGLVNSAPYLSSAIVGAWLADPLNNWFGRRGCIFITAVILVATPIGSAFTHSWQTLFVVRLILGLGMGAKGATVPVFAAENSPAPIRGALVMGWQLWTAFGIFLGNCANLVVAKVGPIAWRLQLGSAFIPAFPLMLFILLLPESPRWLMKKNRYQQAYKSLTRLRFTELQAARDLYYIHVQLVEESKIVKAGNFFIRLKELFTIPRVRRATWASGTVMLAQQLCGINIIAFYSSTVFVNAGFDPYQALAASAGFGAINWVFAFPALYAIDTFGRRNLLLSTFPNMAWTLLAAGLCFLIDPDQPTSKLRLGLVALFIYIFTAIYSVGEGPVPFAYSAEVFPLSHREIGMAWAVAVCLGYANASTTEFCRILTTEPLLIAAYDHIPSHRECFHTYGRLRILLRPQSGRVCDDLPPGAGDEATHSRDQVFSMRHGTFVGYQYRKAVPYFIQRYIFFRKDVKLEPLYDFDDSLLSMGESDFSQRHAGRKLAHHHDQPQQEKLDTASDEDVKYNGNYTNGVAHTGTNGVAAGQTGLPPPVVEDKTL